MHVPSFVKKKLNKKKFEGKKLSKYICYKFIIFQLLEDVDILCHRELNSVDRDNA